MVQDARVNEVPMKLTMVLPLLLLLPSMESCSSSSTPSSKPVIDNLTVPSTAMSANGIYTLQGMMTVHDTGGAAITRMHLHAPPAADPPDTNFPQAITQGTFAVEFLFQGSAGLTVNYQVSVFDSNGVESAPVSESVTLQ